MLKGWFWWTYTQSYSHLVFILSELSLDGFTTWNLYAKSFSKWRCIGETPKAFDLLGAGHMGKTFKVIMATSRLPTSAKLITNNFLSRGVRHMRKKLGNKIHKKGYKKKNTIFLFLVDSVESSWFWWNMYSKLFPSICFFSLNLAWMNSTTLSLYAKIFSKWRSIGEIQKALTSLKRATQERHLELVTSPTLKVLTWATLTMNTSSLRRVRQIGRRLREQFWQKRIESIIRTWKNK